MQLHKIALADTHAFSNFFIDYVNQKEQLKDFYHHFPIPANFNKQVTEKSGSFSIANRAVLQESLTAQYQKLKLTELVKTNIGLLGKANTFTVTTGHQLNVFTGPLFFIYKIVTVINACKELKKQNPGSNFVPVYWMASEDHDYEEIKSFILYGKKYSWETDQKGAVGRFNPKSISTLLNEVPGDITVFKDAYLKQPTLADAVRYYVNELFGEQGLVCVDGDDAKLKSLFKSVIEEDIFKHTPKTLVEEKNKKLQDLGYHTQVFARDINFFYLKDNIRSRIEKTGDTFKVLDTDIQFSVSAMKAEIESHPERFSPNVILRPLYQEMILPNIAYVGGPAEMIYWLQLKGIFDLFKTPFPFLVPRNFALIIEGHLLKKWNKTELELSDLFKEKNFLFNHWVLKNTHHDLTLGKELNALKSMIDGIQTRAAQIDPTLKALVAAEGKRAVGNVEKIEKKMLKAEKRLHSEKLKQIETVKDALFPGGHLQERTDNFLNFYQKDKNFIAKMMEHLDPFDFRFNIICDDED